MCYFSDKIGCLLENTILYGKFKFHEFSKLPRFEEVMKLGEHMLRIRRSQVRILPGAPVIERDSAYTAESFFLWGDNRGTSGYMLLPTLLPTVIGF